MGNVFARLPSLQVDFTLAGVTTESPSWKAIVAWRYALALKRRRLKNRSRQ